MEDILSVLLLVSTIWSRVASVMRMARERITCGGGRLALLVYMYL